MVFHHVLRMEKYIACLGHFQIRKKSTTRCIGPVRIAEPLNPSGVAGFARNVIGTLCSGHRIDLDADKPLDSDLNHLILIENKPSCPFQTHQENTGKIGNMSKTAWSFRTSQR